MKSGTIFIIVYTIIFTVLLIGAIVYYESKEPIIINNCDEKIFDGCWADIKEYIKNEDGKVITEIDKADWVCVNVRDMSYERALEVCNHEVGHEIFAEYCENNINECIEVTKNEN